MLVFYDTMAFFTILGFKMVLFYLLMYLDLLGVHFSSLLLLV